MMSCFYVCASQLNSRSALKYSTALDVVKLSETILLFQEESKMHDQWPYSVYAYML